MSWYEVETKIKIDNPKVIRENIKKIAFLKKKEIKFDEYYAITRKGYPKKAFRIRRDGKKIVVNFKKWDKKHTEKEIVVKEEFEFSINNLRNFLLLMTDLGFSKWMRKIKISESYCYHKDHRLSIELNKVKYLGNFIEIEYLCSKHEIIKAKEKIKKALSELGFIQEQIDNTGYTKMLWKKKIN